MLTRDERDWPETLMWPGWDTAQASLISLDGRESDVDGVACNDLRPFEFPCMRNGRDVSTACRR